MNPYSLDKAKIKILLLEGIHASAADAFRMDGYSDIECRPKALAGPQLAEALASAQIVGIRSATHLTADILRQVPKLIAVGCFCIGTNQVDLDAAQECGIAVFNTPFSNTRSVAELVLAETILLLRGIPQRNAPAHRGVWAKSATGSYEVRGKCLGIVGYGHIGTQVGVLAEGLGRQVVSYDPVAKLALGNACPLPNLEAVLEQADVVTLHVPETPATHRMIGREQLARMKPGARLVNATRSTVVEIEALAEALRTQHLSGAAIDVFPHEPKGSSDEFVSPLHGLANMLPTPHVGGSTEEAQQSISVEVADKLIKYSDNGSSLGAANFSEVWLPERAGQPGRPASRRASDGSAGPAHASSRLSAIPNFLMRSLAVAAAFAIAVSAAAQVPAAAVAGFTWRSIGPASTGGRIADFAVAQVKGQPEVMYVGTASGGVFKSSNSGVSWTPVFDHSGGMMSIGAVAVAPSNPSIVWVGTGEVDNRQSSSWGDGIFKSLDGGATWHNMGLAETRHIGKIIVDPTNADIVYVAALGHLWGSNPERGVYKTTDGGHSWKKVLYTDDNTGATDLAMSPSDPNLIFAAMYQRQRKGWGYNGGGPGSGIYRSSDAGATWTELTKGLPSGDKGRIGLAINPTYPRIVYAIVEADPPAGRGGAPGGGRAGRGNPAALKGGIFRSLDQGQSWEHMSGLNPRPSYYSRIYLDPTDPNRVYIMGSERGFYISDDAGRTFRDIFSEVHGEDHAMWVDPANPNHLLIGGDGGVSMSYDRGLTWTFRNNMPIGQFYNIDTNNATPYLICGGLQDNGDWCIPSATKVSIGISNGDSFNIGSGDGMQAIFDGGNNTMLVSSQNGATNRVSLDTMERQNIGPVQPDTPTEPGRPNGYRWYWTSPLIVSHFNPKVIYTGANILFRSADQGVSWKAISPDLTAHIDRDKLKMMGAPIPADALSKNDGQSNFSTLTVIAESPLDASLLYTGADDGTLEVTRDGGAHWTNLTKNISGLQDMTNVSGIIASKYAVGRVYATFDGHFNDDYHPYIYVSDDYGQSWRAINAGLPQTSVHRLRENPANPDFLVAGTEEGVYASWDRGAHWTSLNTNLPPVPVYDLVYQQKTGDLVLGTHGRGIWILDDAAPLAAFTPAIVASSGHLFPIPVAHRQTIYTPQAWYGAGEFFAPNPPDGATIGYYLGVAAKDEAKGKATISIADAAGQTIRTFSAAAQPGLNGAQWDLRYDAPVPQAASAGPGRGRPADGPIVEPGAYTVTVRVAGIPALTGQLGVIVDPESHVTPAEARQRAEAVMSAYHLQQRLAPAHDAAVTLGRQLDAMRAYLAAMQSANMPAADSLETVQKSATQLGTIAADIDRALAQAAAAQRTMDAYEGLPTASQLRQLDWAWQDAAHAVTALNLFLKQGMPSTYAVIGGKTRWSAVAPLAPIVRP